MALAISAACAHCTATGGGWPGSRAPSRSSANRRCAPTVSLSSTKLAREPLGGLGMVHLRWATPGLGINERNSHPFRYGPYVFAHNGAIHPQDRLPEMLPPDSERELVGTTDSERYFLLIMSRLAANGGDMVAAIADAAADIDRRFEPNSLNAILLSPDKLYAVSWYDRGRVPEAKLRLARVQPSRTRSPRTSTWPTGQQPIRCRRQFRLAAGRLDTTGEPAIAGGRPAHRQCPAAVTTSLTATAASARGPDRANLGSMVLKNRRNVFGLGTE